VRGIHAEQMAKVVMGLEKALEKYGAEQYLAKAIAELAKKLVAEDCAVFSPA